MDCKCSLIWRLSEAGEDNLGLSCTENGLILGRTPLVERRGNRFAVRDWREIERLLTRAYQSDPPTERIMRGLSTVASALNANDPCLARIAAVHLRLPDLSSRTARDDMEMEDVLIKSADWDPALHPRTGEPPNPGWFGPTDGSANESSRDRTAANDGHDRNSKIESASFRHWSRHHCILGATMYFHVYLRNGTVYLPTMGMMDKGFYRGIEPVAVVQVTNTAAVRQALAETIARGNPIVPMLLRRQWPPPVLLKYAGLKNWSVFERGMTLWGIEERSQTFSIIGKRKKPDGTTGDDPAQTVTFPPGSTVVEVIDRMIAILQDAAQWSK